MERSKLLAAVAVLALVVCAFVAIIPSEVQGATIQVDAPEGADTLQTAINAAQPGDTLVLAEGTYTPDDGVYEISKNITIRAVAGDDVTIKGSFLVNANNATFENLTIAPNGGTGAQRNGITFLGVSLTVTDCSFTAGESVFSNGISFWPATSNANLNVTGSTFNGFETISDGYSSSAITYAINTSVTSYFPDYTENNGLSAIITTTEEQLLSMYESNEFTGCVNAIAFHNWGVAENTEDSGYYIVNEVFNGQSNITTIIPEGSEITLSTDSMEEENETIINYGTLTVPNGINTNTAKNTITNKGTVIIENEALPGTIDGGNVIINVIESEADSINYPDMTTGTKLAVQQVSAYGDTGEVTSVQNYTTVLVELTGGKTAIIGIDSVYYSGRNYAGENGNVGVRILSSNVEGSSDSLGFLGMNVVYETRDAAENQGETGDAINAGTYYIRMNLSTFIGGVYATVPVIGEFEILPLKADNVEIEWTTADGSAPEKAYTGSPITLDDSEYNVVVTIDGEEIVFESGQYAVYYDNNTVPGQDTATIRVVLNGNYSGNATANFTISDMYISLEIENEKDTYYIGESIDTNSLTVTGITDYGTETVLTPKTENDNGYILNPETFMSSGEVVVTVTYTVDDVTVTGTFTVTVIGVAGIEITKDPTNTEYDAGTDIDTDGMEIEVTYEDDTVVTFTDSGNGLVANGESEADENFIFTQDAGVGDIAVTVDYFGAQDTFNVTINGYGIIYYVNGEVYGSQVKAFNATDSTATIFNYYGNNNGQQFSGWLIEGTNSVYQPGTAIVVGEDKNMWGDGTENVNIHLIAQFGDGQTTPIQPGETDPATEIYVGIVKDEAGVVITLVGLTADGEYGYIPAGSISISYTTVAWTAMGDVQIPMPQPPVTISEDVAQGQMIVKIPVDNFSGYDSIIGMNVSFSVDEDVIAQNSASYDIVLTAPTA